LVSYKRSVERQFLVTQLDGRDVAVSRATLQPYCASSANCIFVGRLPSKRRNDKTDIARGRVSFCVCRSTSQTLVVSGLLSSCDSQRQIIPFSRTGCTKNVTGALPVIFSCLFARFIQSTPSDLLYRVLSAIECIYSLSNAMHGI